MAELDIDNPCSESYRGPHPFSEPETRAVRDFIMDHINQLKFVVNYHGYGNTILKPFNSVKVDLIKELYPDVDDFLTELVAEGSPPKGLKLTTAPENLGYNSPGEMSDWILAATGIPAVSPELGTLNPCSNTFFIKSIECIVETLDAQYPLVKATFKKIGSQLSIDTQNVDVERIEDGQTKATITITNKGLSNSEEGTIFTVRGLKKASARLVSNGISVKV